MVVNQALVDLGGVHKANGGDTVDFARQACGVIEDSGYCCIGEYLDVRTGSICNMGRDIFGSLAAIQRRDMATQVNALRVDMPL